MIRIDDLFPGPEPERSRAYLLAETLLREALERIEPLLDADEPPVSITFQILFDARTRRPYRVMTRPELRHDQDQ